MKGAEILDRLPVAVITVDAAGAVRRENAAARDLFDGAEGATIADIRAELRLAGDIDGLIARARGGEASQEVVKFPRGRSVVAWAAPAGDVVVVALRDVTAIERTWSRNAEQEKLASVGLLAAGVAHEFNNIMATIYGFAQLAQSKEKFRGELVDVVLTYSRRAREITENLLSFARRKPSAMMETDVRVILETVLSLMERDLRKDNIAVERQFEEVPPTLLSVGKMEEAVVNLITNAKQAIGRNGRITVAVVYAGDEIQVSFQDTGCGIPRENLSRIFEPFFTTKGAFGSGDIPGTGLGLSVVKATVEEHRGRVEVQSEVGKGSTFTITLPVRRERRHRRADVVHDEERRADVIASRSRRVLVVDDEPSIHQLVGGFLERHRVVSVASGAEALALLASEKFDCVVMEVLLAGEVDGFDLFETLRREHPQTRVIIFTGRIEDDRLLGCARRAHGYLRKPFGIKDLLRVVG